MLGINESACGAIALHEYQVSVRWPDDGQKRPKHVAIKIKEANN